VGVAAWRPARWRVAPAVAAAVGCLAGGGHGVCGRRERAIGAAVARRRRRCGREMQTRRSWRRPRGQRTGHVRRVLVVHLLIAPSTAAAPAFSWCLVFRRLALVRTDRRLSMPPLIVRPHFFCLLPDVRGV